MNNTKEAKEVRKKVTPLKLSTDLPRDNTGLNKKGKSTSSGMIIDMTNMNSPEEESTRIAKRPKCEDKVSKTTRVRGTSKKVEFVDELSDTNKIPSKSIIDHVEDDHCNSPYLLAPDFRDVSPNTESFNDKVITESEIVHALVIKVLTSNLSELNDIEIRTINAAIEIINGILVTNIQQVLVRESIQHYYLQEKIGYLELTTSEMNRWKELMYVSLIDQSGINQQEMARTGHHFNYEDTNKLTEKVIMQHLLKVITTEHESTPLENPIEAYHLEIPLFIRIVIKVVDGVGRLNNNKNDEYWKRTLLKLIGDCYDQIDSVSILVIIRSVIDDDNSEIEGDCNSNLDDANYNNDNKDMVSENPTANSHKTSDTDDTRNEVLSLKRGLEDSANDEDDVHIKRGKSTLSKVILTPEKGNDDIRSESETTGGVSMGVEENDNAKDKDTPNPEDENNVQCIGQLLVCNNGDKVILTEERLKTMFTIFMNEINKDKMNDVYSSVTEVTGTKTTKNAQHGECITDMEDTHTAGLMIPGFHYGDTPDNNVHQNDEDNPKINDSKSSLDLTGIMSNELVNNNVNGNTNPQFRAIPASLLECSTLDNKRATSSNAMGVHGATTCTSASIDSSFNSTNNQLGNNNIIGIKTKRPPNIELDLCSKVFKSDISDKYTDSILDDTFEDSDPENDSMIDLHSSANNEKLVKDSIQYLGDLRCQPYSTYFNVSEDYVHPANSKALRKQITEVLDKCQLYGNIGSIHAMLNGNSVDLHIDLYGNLCQEIKGLPFNSIIDKKLLSFLYLNNDERSTNVKELSKKPHIFLSKHIMEYPVIEKVDYRVIKDIHNRMKQVYYDDDKLVESCRYLKLPKECQYDAIKSVIKYTNKLVNLMFKPHWSKSCIEVTSRSASSILLNDKEKFILKNKDTVFSIDVVSVFNELKDKYMDLMVRLLVIVLRVQLMIYVQDNNTTKLNSKDQRRVWMLDEYKGIPFPLPKTFFTSPANTLARSYEELTCKDLFCKLQESIFSVYAVSLSCKLHELCLAYNKVNSFRVQIFESAIISLPIALKENLMIDYLPTAAMELLQMNYNMMLYMCTDKCLALAVEVINKPKEMHTTSELDNLLIDMNKERIELKVIDTIKVDLKISIRGLQLLEQRRSYSKQRKIDKAIRKRTSNCDKVEIISTATPTVETDKDIAASMVDNSSLQLNSLSRLLNTVENEDDDDKDEDIGTGCAQLAETNTSKDIDRLSPISSGHEDERSNHSLDLRITSSVTTNNNFNNDVMLVKEIVFNMNKWLPPAPKKNKQIINTYCMEGVLCDNADCSRYHPMSWKYYSKEYVINPCKYLTINDISIIECDWKKPHYNLRKGQEVVLKNCWYGIHCELYKQQSCWKLHPDSTGKIDSIKQRIFKNNIKSNNFIVKSADEYSDDKVINNSYLYSILSNDISTSTNIDSILNNNLSHSTCTTEIISNKKANTKARTVQLHAAQVECNLWARMEGRKRRTKEIRVHKSMKGIWSHKYSSIYYRMRNGKGNKVPTKDQRNKYYQDINKFANEIDLIDNDLNIANTGIHNLTKYTFTKDEYYLLSLGLKFKLPFKRAHADGFIVRHFDTFARSLRCSKAKLLMHDHDSSYNAICTRVNKLLYKLHGEKYINAYASYNLPLPSQYALPIEKYISDSRMKLKKVLRRYPVNHFRHSVNNQQLIKLYRTINNLKRNKSILIKPTDKNLGIAVIDITEYDAAMIKKLNNGNYMRCDDFDMTTVCIDLINRFIKFKILRPLVKPQYINYQLPLDWKQFEFEPQFKEITQLIMYYFSHPDLIKLCRLKLLPKVHKTPLDWREICANPKWLTSIGSLTVHLLLYPILKEVPSYIHNSNEVIIELINNEFSDTCAMLQADIESMYPSIDIVDGLNTLQIVLAEDGRYTIQVQELILTITEWVLYNNYMSYKDDVYKQINGTSMGTSLSVTYSCLYIAHKEKLAIEIMKYRKFKDPLLYKRLVDDCAGIFYDEIHAKEFMNILEHVTNDKIKFDYKISTEDLVFLDVTIFKGKDFKRTNTLSSKLYQKANNKYLFIPPFSSHPTSVYKAWIEDYIKRIRILCSHDQDYEYFKSLFYKRLLDRGFKTKHLRDIFSKNYNRNALIRSIMDRMQFIQTNWNYGINDKTYKAHEHQHAIVLPDDHRVKMILPKIKKILRHDKHLIRYDEHYNKLFPYKITRIRMKTNNNIEQLINKK